MRRVGRKLFHGQSKVRFAKIITILLFFGLLFLALSQIEKFSGQKDMEKSSQMQKEWDTYKQNNLWQIEYPTKWNVLNSANVSKNRTIGFSDGEDLFYQPEVGIIYVGVAWDYKYPIDEFLKMKIGESRKMQQSTITILEKLKVDGYDAVKVEVKSTPKDKKTLPTYAIFTYVKGPFSVSIWANNLRYDVKGNNDIFEKNYLPKYNQMLGSFKFLK